VTEQLSRRWRRFIVGLSGGVVVIVGIIAIPYPGPGWLIVFAGLAILAKEFPWAGRVLKYARGRYEAWEQWVRRQSWFIRSLTALFTLAVVVLTLWLLNVYEYTSDFLHLGWNWVRSPLPWFY